MIDRLRHGYGRLMHWMERNWGPREMFLSYVGPMVAVVWLTSIMLGVIEAYHVDSAAEILTTEGWGELLAGAEEFDSGIMSSMYLLLAAFAAAWVEVGGRITYDYLLWVPEQVWVPLFRVVSIALVGVVALNVLYLWHLARTHSSDSLFGGGIDG